MPYWSGEELHEKLKTDSELISDFSEGRIDCNSYTLRMGNCYFRTADTESGGEQKKIFLSSGEPFTIPAGQFAYLLSKETISVPKDSMAFISMRTPIKFQGIINVSGFHVDPGYRGKLIYAVYNASPSPVQICENDPIFKIWFAHLDRESGPNYTYQKQGLHDISNELVRGMSREILSLQSVSEKIRNLESEINTKFAEQKPIIDNLTFVWRAIILGVVVTAVLTVLSAMMPAAWQAGQHALELLGHTKTAPPISTPPNAP